MTTETSLFALLVVAALVAVLARRLRLPYTVLLVTAGIGLAALADAALLPSLDAVRLTPTLVFHVLLPVLVFEASFHISWLRFRESVRAILLLALPGVVLAVVTGGALTYLLESLLGTAIPLTVAVLISAILAATDPVSVVALFKELGVPERLGTIVEGESLLNDAIGVVAFTVCAGMLGLGPAGEAPTGGELALHLCWEIGIGVVAGIAVGLFVSWATTLVDDHLVEIMLTTVAAFGSYLAAEALGASPILAVVASGMTCGNVAARIGMTPENRIAVESFWEYCVFAANGFVFLLLGKEVHLARLLEHVAAIVAAWVALALARALVVLVVDRVLWRTRERLPRRWPAVLVWGGLRGALSMVLALGIPDALPERELVVDITFGVVVLSILVQGMTMTPVLRWATADTHSAGADAGAPAP
ncbi:MAG: sodium:proton antiporter [Sandaracinus sp.]